MQAPIGKTRLQDPCECSAIRRSQRARHVAVTEQADLSAPCWVSLYEGPLCHGKVASGAGVRHPKAL
jgi:hypothetical protein